MKLTYYKLKEIILTILYILDESNLNIYYNLQVLFAYIKISKYKLKIENWKFNYNLKFIYQNILQNNKIFYKIIKF